MTERPLRVAVVGSGPAGCYAAGHLIAGPGGTYLDGTMTDLYDRPVEVDVLERLPTPWGLVRAGVAPDHPEKKRVSRVFDAIAARDGVRFFGNVEVGVHVTHEQLADWYDAVIYAVGADGDVRMDIPGEDLPGCHSAREFVAWYSGHPDHADLRFDLSADRAIVVGNGNVALDIARVLTLADTELRRTDMADHALEALAGSAIREVVVLGRRGRAQAAFSNPELEELAHLEGVDVTVEGDPGDARDGRGEPVAARLLETLRRYAARRPTGARKRIVLRFLASPTGLRGDGRVQYADIARNELVEDEHRTLRARTTDDVTALPAGLVLRAVGYRGRPLSGLPFDERRGIITNTDGRVDDVPGAYVTGWIRRGPSGIIGTNKKCARDTVRALLADHAAGLLDTTGTVDAAGAAHRLAAHRPQLVTQRDWKILDRHERDRGAVAGRPRVKITERGAMLDLMAQE